ncbi:hypothetical protein TNCV_472801 [Trichonephila clavipes]|nr:hypothetical protein TNCV_472801 [Trichonephila clavipes]
MLGIIVLLKVKVINPCNFLSNIQAINFVERRFNKFQYTKPKVSYVLTNHYGSYSMLIYYKQFCLLIDKSLKDGGYHYGDKLHTFLKVLSIFHSVFCTERHCKNRSSIPSSNRQQKIRRLLNRKAVVDEWS